MTRFFNMGIRLRVAMVVASIIAAHLLHLVGVRYPFVGMIASIVIVTWVLVWAFKARGWTVMIFVLFAVQVGHIITRKTTFPFSNVGMYGWVQKTRHSASDRVVLRDSEGKVVPARALAHTHTHTHTHTHRLTQWKPR